MAYSPDQMRAIGAELWRQRQHVLQTSDINADGAFTVADVYQWFLWWFFYPGDFFVVWLMVSHPDAAIFLELGPASVNGWSGGVTGWLSLAVSVAVWVTAYVLWEKFS